MPSPLLLVTSLPAADEAAWRDALGAAMPAQAQVTGDAKAGEGKIAMCIGCHGATLAGGQVPGGPPDWPAAVVDLALSGLRP